MVSWWEVGVSPSELCSPFCSVNSYIIDLFYGGEAMSSDQPQAFTCPYCGKMGYTDATLQEHVASDHVEASHEVVKYCLKFHVQLIILVKY